MRSLLILLFCCNFLLSCDDGDVLNVQLDFDKNLTLCEPPASSNFILYDTKNDPSESLTLLFPDNAQAQSILYPTVSGNMETMTINNSTVEIHLQNLQRRSYYLYLPRHSRRWSLCKRKLRSAKRNCQFHIHL